MSGLSRQEFIAGAAAFAASPLCATGTTEGSPVVRFGLVADIHYADREPLVFKTDQGGVEARHFRLGVRKLDEAVAAFNARKLDFAVELGDFKDDSGGREPTLRHLEEIERSFAKFKGPRYHVMGNHDFDCLKPEEFYARTPNDGVVPKRGYYSFVRAGMTFIVLDGCYTSDFRHYSEGNPWTDANIPPEEFSWFEKTLAAAQGPVVVFCHQRIDPSAERHHLLKNAADVRAVLEKSGKVKGVFTGHEHGGGLNRLNGIPYYSLKALVCGEGADENSYAEVAFDRAGSFTVTGFKQATSWKV